MITPAQIKMIVAGVVFIGWTGLVAYTAKTYERRGWEAATERLKADAARELAEGERRARDAENRAAEAAAQADGAYIAAQAKIDSTNADFDRRLNERLRVIEAGRARCGGDLPRTATDTGDIAPIAGSGDNGPRGPDSESVRQLRRHVLTLQAYARTCHGWTASVGR